MNPVSDTIVQIDLGTSVAQAQYMASYIYNVIYGAAGVVGAFAFIMAIWKKQEGIVGKLQEILNYVACNFGYAKNSEQPK